MTLPVGMLNGRHFSTRAGPMMVTEWKDDINGVLPDRTELLYRAEPIAGRCKAYISLYY